MAPATETQLLECIVDLARRMLWALHHDRPARTEKGWRTAVQGNAGFPDLVLARDGVVIFRELKGPRGALTPEQHDWARQVCPGWLELRGHMPDDEARVIFDVWRPQHWDTRIVPLLTRPRRGSLDYQSPSPDAGQGELPDLRDRGTALGRIARR